MSTSTIPQLQETGTPTDEYVLPVDSGIQTYKLTLANLFLFIKAALQATVDLVTESMITNGAVTTDKIGTKSVTNFKIAAGDNNKVLMSDGTDTIWEKISNANINDGTIQNAKLAANAVDTANVVDGSITNNKLAGSITNDKLAGSISQDKLAGSIPYSKLSFSNNIVAGDIASGAVGGSELASTLSGNKTWSGTQSYTQLTIRFTGGDGDPAYLGRGTDGTVVLRSGGLTTTGNSLEILGTGGTILARFRDIDSGSSAFRCDRTYDETTSSAANVNITSSGNFQRSTSSRKYKRDIEDAQKEHYRKVLELKPVFYRAKGTNDADLNWSYWGFIAEDVAEIDPRLAQWRVPDNDDDSPGKGKNPQERIAMATPDGVDYGRVAVLLQAVVRDHDAELTALRNEIEQLKTQLAVRETRNG